jgi:hypothetical protein
MTSIAEANARVAKAITNMDRFNDIVNGGVNDLIAVDGGQVRSLRGISEYGKPGVAGAGSSIGLFSNASAQSIPFPRSLMLTDGATAAGRGVTVVANDPAVNAAFVAANPRWSFLSSEGRGFKIAMLTRGNPLVSEFGAHGVDDTASLSNDDSDALRAMIAAAHMSGSTLPGLPGGGTVEIDRSYYINQTVELGKWITLSGRHEHDELLDHQGGNNLDKSATTAGARPGTIILGPQGKLLRNDGSGVYKLAILGASAAAYRSTAGKSATAAEVNALIASYNNYPLAVDTVSGAAGVFADHCFIAGFALGIKQTYNERWRVSWCKFDCVNGFYATQTYDDARYFANHHFPFIWGHRFADGTADANTVLANYGTAIKFDNTIDPSRSIDGGHVFCNLTYGYMIGIDLLSTNGLHCYDNWIDGDVSSTVTLNTIGIRTSGNCRRTKIILNHIDSQGRCLDLQGTGVVTLNDNTTCGATVSHMRIGTGTLVNGGIHLFQGAAPQCIELDPNCGLVSFTQTWFSACNGVAIGLQGGGVPVGVTRRNVSLGKIVVENSGNGWSLDRRLWRSNVMLSNLGGENLTNGTPTQVALDSSVDGYGEWANNAFTPAASGWYSVSGTIGVNLTSFASGNALVAEVRINGIEQALGRFQIEVPAGGFYGLPLVWQGYLDAGKALTIFVYTDNTATVPTGKAQVQIMRIGDG